MEERPTAGWTRARRRLSASRSMRSMTRRNSCHVISTAASDTRSRQFRWNADASTIECVFGEARDSNNIDGSDTVSWRLLAGDSHGLVNEAFHTGIHQSTYIQ